MHETGGVKIQNCPYYHVTHWLEQIMSYFNPFRVNSFMTEAVMKVFMFSLNIHSSYTVVYAYNVTEAVVYRCFSKNFATFTEKQLCWSLFFNKAIGPNVCNSIKNRLQHRCFLCLHCKNF